MENISVKLYELIEKSGKTYRDLEELTGIPHSTLQRYATGKTNKIPIDKLQALCQVLGTSADVLMGWTADQPDDEPPASSDDPTFITLAHKLRKLDPENLKKVDKALTALFPEDFT